MIAHFCPAEWLILILIKRLAEIKGSWFVNHKSIDTMSQKSVKLPFFTNCVFQNMVT